MFGFLCHPVDILGFLWILAKSQQHVPPILKSELSDPPLSGTDLEPKHRIWGSFETDFFDVFAFYVVYVYIGLAI